MNSDFLPSNPAKRALIGFLAGVISTLTFHEIGLFLVNTLGIANIPLFNMRPTGLIGAPAVLNLSFWGGVWGIVYVFLVDRFPRAVPVLVAGYLFAILLPSLFGWTVLAASRGQPLFAGFDIWRMMIVFIANGLWGIGLPILCKAMSASKLLKSA